jgi:hypothetical protein
VAFRRDKFSVGAYEVAPGLFFGVAVAPEIKHRIAAERLLGWKYHDAPTIRTTHTPAVVIGLGLNVTQVDDDARREDLPHFGHDDDG